MISRVLVLLLICLMGVSAALGQATEEQREDSAQIVWVNDFVEAQEQALADNKLILLDFYSDT